ncbi:hypothetical protein [Rhizobium phage RHph_X2_26]|nr:hypothetical protein [Rhizobium phage RHph_X2_26]
MLEWRTLVPSRSPQHLVKGTELEVCFPAGYRHRFALYTVRVAHWERDPSHIEGGYMVHDARYRVRDADTINDAQVRAGVRPLVTGEFDTLDAALKFIAESA